AEARVSTVLEASSREELQAEAKAQERRSPDQDLLSENRLETRLAKPPHAFAESTHAGQDDGARFLQRCRFRHKRRVRVDAAKCVHDRAQVAHAVIDDGDLGHQDIQCPSTLVIAATTSSTSESDIAGKIGRLISVAAARSATG